MKKIRESSEDFIGEKSAIDKGTTDHVVDHRAEINTLVDSSNALVFEGALSTLFSMYFKFDDGEEDLAKPSGVTTLHTGSTVGGMIKLLV
jgi:hypothetical protein